MALEPDQIRVETYKSDFNSEDDEPHVVCCTPPHRDYKDPHHADNVLRLLERDTEFSDVFIEAEGERVKVHKSLFGVCSDFFKKAFSTEMREKYDNVVKLEGVRAEVMKSIVGFFYSGKIDISSENAIELLAAADYLMTDGIKQCSVKYLAENVNLQNCFAIWHCGKKYEINELAEKSADFIGSHLDQALKADDMQKLSTSDFKEIMEIGKKFRCSEQVTYDTILSWVEENLEKRKAKFSAMFLNLDLSQLSKQFLEEKILRQPLVNQSSEHMTVVANELVRRNNQLCEEKDLLVEQLDTTTRKLNVKLDEQKFIFASDNDHYSYKFDITSGTWKKLPLCGKSVTYGPHTSFTYAGNLNGEHIFEIQDNNEKKFVKRIKCTGYSDDKCGVVLTYVDEILYAVESDELLDTFKWSRKYTPRVFRYDDVQDEWIKINSEDLESCKAEIRRVMSNI